MHLVVRLFFALILMAPLVSGVAGQGSVSPWIAMVWVIKDGLENGSGVYLRSGLILTAAHLVNTSATMGVRIAGKDLPATVLKQGVFEEVDLSLLLIDEQQLPVKPAIPNMQICEGPPWPGDRVIVIDARVASQSHIVSPQDVPPSSRKFSTLIADAATTGSSGSGVFDPDHRCLHGIISRRITFQTSAGAKRDYKYFVPASDIRKFISE